MRSTVATAACASCVACAQDQPEVGKGNVLGVVGARA
jgi:hypothetical protein